MFKEFIAFMLVVTIIIVLVSIFRMRSKKQIEAVNGQEIGENNDEEIRENEQTFVESLNRLTIPQLENKIQKLERRMVIISSGFVSMHPYKQQRVVEGVQEIKAKISVINETIERHRFSK